MVPGRITRCSAVALVLLLASTADAATYFVKNGGNNALDGLSLANAWATLNHAASVVNPGDTVHVQDGSYQGFYLDRSGTAGSPITFVADGPNVLITADNGTTPDGINVEGAGYVVIDGFVVNNRTRAGIRVAVSQFVTVRNCKAGYNGRWGIFSGFADDLMIENNETHHSVAEHGIYVSNSGDRPIIRGNVSHDNNANGIHMNGDESQGGDGLISNAVVERNVIYGNGTAGGSGINMDGVTNSVVRNNLLYDNHASGISLYQIDGATGSRNNLIINNTVINASNARWCININSGSTGNTLRNNILYNYHSFRGVITVDSASLAGFSSDYNSLMNRMSADGDSTILNLSGWQALGYDAHSFVATPTDHFVVPTSDFHLLDTSPAIDAGTTTNAPATDLDGGARPVGSGVDIGAYERQLLHCGDGNVDAGEQCGEPALDCGDPCTTCIGCSCVAAATSCGDSLVCGSEQCEGDSDCGGGQVCSDCQCINAPLCGSGIAATKVSLKAASDPFSLKFKGRAVIPKPWVGIDPIANGIHLRIDSPSGAEVVDVVVPGGAAVNEVGWFLSRSGMWKYRDRDGVQGPVQQVVVRDMSSKEDGLIAWTLKARGGTATLPAVDSVRSTIVLGAAGECAANDWNGPTGLRPRCSGDSTALRCR